ncbi:MAG TPA: hypothetical protein VEI02_13340, partial [Planctomycetota bacterium]|nr:hypothetical protein [Planctomycetota bacterium]
MRLAVMTVVGVAVAGAVARAVGCVSVLHGRVGVTVAVNVPMAGRGVPVFVGVGRRHGRVRARRRRMVRAGRVRR